MRRRTGGLPGPNDGVRELAYRAIAIADLDSRAFVAHEFTPTRDPLASIGEAVDSCDD